MHHAAIQQFVPEKKYDFIISNPPYFNNSQRPPGERRHQARHTVALPFDELIAATLRLLAENGKLNIILPFAEGLEFVGQADRCQLFCSRKYTFRTRKEKPVERLLLEFSKSKDGIDTGEIILYKNDGEWSDEYARLTADFYLKL